MGWNRMSGIRAQRKGAQFEGFIDKILVFLRNQNKAKIFKKDTPIGYQRKRCFNPNHKDACYKIFFKKKSTVDFEGYLKGGRHVSFELKNVQNGNKYVWSNQHQIQYLYDAWKNNVLSFLLIYGKDGFYKFIPDDRWDGRKSMTLHFEDGIHIPWDSVYDFLEINN